jgi:hypothetical protein
MKKLSILLIVFMLLAIAVVPAFAAIQVYYTGQGFTSDGTTWSINSNRCGLATANDGGTGQFIGGWPPPSGTGDYQSGDPYMVWVLTLNASPTSGVMLKGGPFGAGVPMYQVGGTWKYASLYYSPDVTINVVYAEFDNASIKASVLKNVNLTVSHGCPPREGGWCSPGYWLNTLNFTPNGWTTIGVDPYNTMFNSSVYDAFYGALLSPDVSLYTVLSTSGGTYKGPGVAGTDPRTQPPYDPLNPFNAVGAWATDQIPGYQFDPTLVGTSDSCPIDAHGAFKD